MRFGQGRAVRFRALEEKQERMALTPFELLAILADFLQDS